MIMGVPYDVEIEYLQSSGTQYINTGVNIATTDDIIVTYYNVTPMSSSGRFLQGFNANAYAYWGVKNGYYEYNGSLSNIAIGKNDTFVYTRRKSSGQNYVSFSVNGNVFAETTSAQNSTGELQLFNLLGIFGGPWKMGRIVVNHNGVVVRDFIPVSVGQVGYMYDRVSKKLFGNQGTGNFILGPDVAKPVMGIWKYRDIYSASGYIRNGLVAIWDGIENAGWGTHSDSIITWYDNVSNQPATIPTNSDVYTWESDGLKRVGTKGMVFSTSGIKQTDNSDAYTLEFVFWAPNATYGNSAKGFLYSSNNQVRLTFQDNNTLNIIIDSASYPSSGLTAPILQPHHYAWVKTSTPNGTRYDAAVYVDAISKGGNVVAGTSFTSGGINVFRVFNDWENETTMKMYALRLYNRALTADEIAYNYMIDKVRFNLP